MPYGFLSEVRESSRQAKALTEIHINKSTRAQLSEIILDTAQ
jgi:hypothetical protein